MQKIREETIGLLKELLNCGLSGIKVDFESEGSSVDELKFWKDIILPLNIPLCVKIGGAEAVRDIENATINGARKIIAPMVETPFALSKYISAFNRIVKNKNIERVINIESITALENFDKICKLGNGFIDRITFGRVDFCSSLGKDRNFANSFAIKNVLISLSLKAKKYGYKVNVGGAMSVDSINFLQEVYSYIDCFETRKVVFDKTDNFDEIKKRLELANRLEILALEVKKKLNVNYNSFDDERLKLLENRENSFN